MVDYGPETFGEYFAATYDALYPPLTDHDPMVQTLHELAGRGPALELGIGTGRVALPLAQLGVAVHGIDASPAMLRQLAAKPGGAPIPVTLGDFAELVPGGSYALVYVVFNTFFALLTQEQQTRCFSAVATSLADGGCFLIEAFVPDPGRFDRGQRTQTTTISRERVMLDVAQHDPVQQIVTSQHVILTNRGIQLLPITIRYAWPSELDLMARLAGLRLRARWGGWQQEPFTALSQRHVSVYAR